MREFGYQGTGLAACRVKPRCPCFPVLAEHINLAPPLDTTRSVILFSKSSLKLRVDVSGQNTFPVDEPDNHFLVLLAPSSQKPKCINLSTRIPNLGRTECGCDTLFHAVKYQLTEESNYKRCNIGNYAQWCMAMTSPAPYVVDAAVDNQRRDLRNKTIYEYK
jgi:hypothetical protein